MDIQNSKTSLVILQAFSRPWRTHNIKYYKCRCICGRIFDVPKTLVDTGKRTSCGRGVCNSKVIATLGKRFGKFVVIEYLPNEFKYRCLCDCGQERKVRASKLHSGEHRSCGCIHKELSVQRSKLHYLGLHVAAVRDIMRTYKRGAVVRHYNFNLTEEEFRQLIQSPCHYCKVSHSMEWEDKRRIGKEPPFQYNGIDRLDNTKGYSKENCVPCCSQCNYSKKDLPYKEWRDWIMRLLQNVTNIISPTSN